jgi:hypothetical protein
MAFNLTRPTRASLFHPPTLRLLRNRIPETRLSAEAAGEKEPEGYLFSPAHPKLPRQLVLRVGYVEDSFEARTKLEAVFSSRLGVGMSSLDGK